MFSAMFDWLSNGWLASGYFTRPLQEIANALGVEVDDVEAVLHTCQGFEPTGVMARA